MCLRVSMITYRQYYLTFITKSHVAKSVKIMSNLTKSCHFFITKLGPHNDVDVPDKTATCTRVFSLFYSSYMVQSTLLPHFSHPQGGPKWKSGPNPGMQDLVTSNLMG